MRPVVMAIMEEVSPKAYEYYGFMVEDKKNRWAEYEPIVS
jgi:hypothetical protein